MPRLLNLYEMARPRGEAMWAVLDWAAQQPGRFTRADMLAQYQKAGGGSGSVGGLWIALKKHVAEPGEPTSVEKPIRTVQAGSRGRGGAGFYEWGLSGPLRAPQPPKAPRTGDSPTGDILDRIEAKIGRDALKMAMARWRRMGNLHAIAADIKATIPASLRMDALHAATEHLVDSGKASTAEVDDAEAEVDQGASQATPFTPPKPKAAVQKQAPTPEPDDDEDMGDGWRKVGDDVPDDFFHGDDDDEPAAPVKKKAEPEPVTANDDDDDDMGDGWRKVDDEPAKEAEPKSDPEPEGDAEEKPDDEMSDDEYDAWVKAQEDEEGYDGNYTGVDQPEYPVFLPDPDDEGDKYENAMFRLVNETEIDEHNPIWEKLKDAKDAVDAHTIIKKSEIPPTLQRSALLVAKAIFANTGRDWDSGKKLESRSLRSLFSRSIIG